jgi:hypothetical protein
MATHHYFNYFIFLLILSLFQYSSQQIFITPIGADVGGPTIISRQTFTVQSNDGTPVTITKINIRPGRNINGGSNRLTPFDLMRLADSRMNDFFEAIISRQLQLFQALEQEEERREKENKEKEIEKENENNKEGNNNDNNQNENKNNTIDDKEFELDEENNDNKDKNNNINNDNNNKDDNKEERKKENIKINDKYKNKKKIGKIYVDEEVIKKGNKANNVRLNRKRLTRKEIIFSRVCKYIFYSIILFTFYILIKKLLEILEIIDPEKSEKNVDINIKNNENKVEETKEKVESEVIVNKERENKQN